MIDLEAASHRLLNDQADEAPSLPTLRGRTRSRRRRRITTYSGAAAITIAAALTGLSLAATGGSSQVSVESPSVQTPLDTSFLRSPEALAMTRQGDLVIDDLGTDQILERSTAGTFHVVAGTGRAGYSGDGGPAAHAMLNRPGGLAVGSNGVIYVADSSNNRVRAISPEGTIRTVAGDGAITGPASGRALDVSVVDPQSVAIGPAGQVYITDTAGLQVLVNGTVRTLVPAGARVLKTGGLPFAWLPEQIAVASTGDLYVSNESPKVVAEFTPAGRLLHTWTAYASQLAAGQNASVLVADYGRFALDVITAGALRTTAVFHLGSLHGLDGVFRPSGVAVATDGTVYLDTDGVNGGTTVSALVEVRPGQAPEVLDVGRAIPPTSSATTATPSDTPTTVLAQGTNAKRRLVVTAAGPSHLRLRLYVSQGPGDPVCESIVPSNPGLGEPGKPPASMTTDCQHPVDIPTEGSLFGDMWIAPDHRQWGLLVGRAVGAHRLRLHWHAYTTTVPVGDGWWVAALPDADNGSGIVATPISAAGISGTPFTIP